MDCTRLPLPRTAHISTNPYTAHSACDLPAPLHFYRAMQKRPPQTQAMQEVLTDMAIEDALLAQEEEVEAEAQISALLAALKEAKLVEESAAKAIEAERWDGSLHAHRPGEWDDVALVMPRPLVPNAEMPLLSQPLVKWPTDDGTACSAPPVSPRERLASLRERCRKSQLSWSISDSADDLASRLYRALQYSKRAM